MSQLDITRPIEFVKPWFSQIETVWNEIEAAVNNSDTRVTFLENRAVRHVKVDYIDPITTVLATGPAITIDGSVGKNGDLVLYTNLNTGNNWVYSLSGIGFNAVWTPVELFGPSGSLTEDPSKGDLATASSGKSFANQTAKFDGIKWKVNETIRLFNGHDFWELGSLQTTSILNNSTQEIFNIQAIGSEHIIVNFSILLRGTGHETGQLFISHDNVSVDLSSTGTAVNSSGIEFQASLEGPNLVLRYTSDNTGPDGLMKYYIQRWSDGSGGPSGVPNYTGAVSGLILAAGNDGAIQFNSVGSLAADHNLNWSSSNKVLKLGDMEIHVLSPEISLLDNKPIPETIFSYNSTSYKHVFIKYSLQRGIETQCGQILITNNGTIVSLTNDFSSTDNVGINFYANINGSDVDVKYTSINNGFDSIFRYSVIRWTNS